MAAPNETIRGIGPTKHLSPLTSSKLQLTSLVDMMVILVVFLLKSFSVEGQLMTLSKGLELPSSSSSSSVIPGLVVEVGLTSISVAGRRVLEERDLGFQNPRAGNILTSALSASTDNSDQGSLLVQADRRVPYRCLGEVMRACAEAGWDDVSLIVLGAEQ